jgi:hydrogenase maturation protease
MGEVMGAVKVVFIGNPLVGDDGIGPYLYTELKDTPVLKGFQLMELGVIGLDLISYVEDNDTLIIVDAVHSKKDIGKVRILSEEDLTPDLSLVSQHDFGVEQTAAVLRAYKPELNSIKIVGINVSNIQVFHDKLSDELIQKMPIIKKDVLQSILQIAKSHHSTNHSHTEKGET